MFKPDFQAAWASDLSVGLNGRPAVRMGLARVRFSAKAMQLIGLGIIEMSSRHGLPEGIIKQRMRGNLFMVPPSGSLYFLFNVPEIEAEMHIEIPSEHWSLVIPEK